MYSQNKVSIKNAEYKISFAKNNFLLMKLQINVVIVRVKIKINGT